MNKALMREAALIAAQYGLPRQCIDGIMDQLVRDQRMATLNRQEALRTAAQRRPDPQPATVSLADILRSRSRRITPSRSLIDQIGVVNDEIPGLGWRRRTHLGIEARDTTIGGQPLLSPSPGLQPARLLGGLAITGLNDHLYPRATTRPTFRP